MIEDYSAAWQIRLLTENFIVQKILKDLQAFETKPRDDHPELWEKIPPARF